MKKYAGPTTLVLIISFMLLISFAAFASDRRIKNRPGKTFDQTENQGVEVTNKKPKKTLSHRFVYKPPMRGKPGNRVGGGTRGQENGLPSLAALVPDHTGLTIQAQPSLYWFISETTTSRIEFTLSTKQGIKPLLEANLNISDEESIQGIQCLRLSDQGLSLLPGEEYQWFVALVPDPEARSKDIVAGGAIKRIEPSKRLTERLAKAGEMEIPGIYADEGLWYDVLSSVSALIGAYPDDKNLREKRTFLLEQAGLPEIADYERRK